VRLWTIHPRYLDAKGLVALWREGLLAKKVLEGTTKGYRSHPQLLRFRQQACPVSYMNVYLWCVFEESRSRGYNFNDAKLHPNDRELTPIEETVGQLRFEWRHLLNKLSVRDSQRYHRILAIADPVPAPVFRIVGGGVRDWEKRSSRAPISLKA
jgi:hypothetical protein